MFYYKSMFHNCVSSSDLTSVCNIKLDSCFDWHKISDIDFRLKVYLDFDT